MLGQDAQSRRPDITKAAQLGLWDTGVVIVVLTLDLFLPGPNRLPVPDYLVLLGPAVAVMAVVAVADHYLSDKRMERLFYAWSAADISFISIVVALSGGGHSPMYLLYVLTLQFCASCYPRRAQLWLNCFTLAAYLGTLAVTGWHIALAMLAVRLTVLVLVAFTASAIAADKDRHAAEADRRASLLRCVAATAREVNVFDADRVCSAVVDAVLQLGMKAGHISVVDEESGTYSMIATLGIPDEYARARVPITQGIVGLVLRARSTVSLDEKSANEYVVPVLNETNLTAVIGCPLWVDGELVGVLAGATRAKRYFGPEDVEAFELLAAVASRALEGARRFKQVADSEAQTRYQATHDELTGLGNRRLLKQEVASRVTARDRGASGRLLAVLLVDLDDFKLVNDTMGHAVGDEVLLTVTGRLLASVREEDMVARLSSDEFAILVQGMDQAALKRLAERVRRKVNQPMTVEGHTMALSASVGIATEPLGGRAGEGPEEQCGVLLGQADMALWEAKRSGKSCHFVFDQAMSERMNKRVAIEAQLPFAIANGEMTVHYQPIFELATGCITGCEALLRWSHPALGPVAPMDFIPLAEESGAIIPIGLWVLQQACSELAAIHAENDDWTSLTMSVNLSPRQLRDPGLVAHVLRVLKDTSVAPWQLTMEITESSLLQDAKASRARLGELATLGIQVALDDFGTGYSSLAYLQQLHVHSLKIDKCFVDGVNGTENDRTARALVRSVVELSNALELSTVAEGVETESQLNELRLLGCRLGQGYVFSPAVTAERLRALLEVHGQARRTPALGTAVEVTGLEVAVRRDAGGREDGAGAY